MPTLDVCRVRLEGDAVCDGRRGGRGVVSDLGEGRLLLAVELRRHHLGLDAVVGARGSDVAVLVIVVVVAAVEVGGALVLVGAAMLWQMSATRLLGEGTRRLTYW